MNSHDKKIVLTGGGTAGHVMPNLALVGELKNKKWQIEYIGTRGIEKKLVTDFGLPFHEIFSGKLRRSPHIKDVIKNIFDVLFIFWGMMQSFFILKKLKPNLVFSKGGFVSVPVATAAWLLKIPVITHESDITPGLANRILFPMSRYIFYTFPSTKKYLPEGKAFEMGSPIREELLHGDKKRGLAFCGFSDEKSKPVLLVMGGSQGALRINQALEKILPNLVEKFYVIHLTGKGKQLHFKHPDYRGFEFVSRELPDIFAATDIVVSRAGANSIFELLELKKPMLLIPLQLSSRGDQVKNAEEFLKNGWALIQDELTLTDEKLLAKINELYSHQNEMILQMEKFLGTDSRKKIAEFIHTKIIQ